MAKTNYTKVEDALTAGLRKMSVDRLLELADEAAGKGRSAEEQGRLRGQVLAALHTELTYLKSQGHSPYKHLGIDKGEIDRFINDPALLTPQEWEKIKVLKKQIEDFKKQIEKNLPRESNEALVEDQRKKQVNKRFNVNDKWLPL